MLGERVDIGGRSLHIVAAGNGSPTVVFESGGAGGSAIQDMPLLRRVSTFTRAAIYDRAGLGWSDPAPPGRSFAERAADLHEILVRTQKPPFVLVGSSFGGLLARMFCKLYPNDVAGMVLVDGGDEAKYFSTMPRMRARHEREVREEAERADSGELRARLEKALSRTQLFTDAEKAAFLEVVPRRSHYMTALDEFTAIDATPPEQQRAGGFGTLGSRPLIVLSHGIPGTLPEWEEGYDASQDYLASLSTNGIRIVAEGVGHSIGMEHPDLVAAAIRAVVETVRGKPFDVGEVRRLARSVS
ncbi:MAG TPA: alpha/beta hydrolase [Rhizomicrobium sp.]|nr:alpha/beta hydrolase [Rhizomicrobium sp.]